jgi:effector-binding domain-containing protein
MGFGLMTLEPGMRVVLPEGSPAGVPTEDVAGEARRDVLPGGPAATTIHTGPYDQLGGAYAALEKWMATEGFAPAGPPWESYITDPAEHPDPKDWQTEVLWPIQPA